MWQGWQIQISQYLWPNWLCFDVDIATTLQGWLWYPHKILPQWDFGSIIISKVDRMTEYQVKQSDEFRKWHHFTVKKPLNQEKTTLKTYHDDLQNLRPHKASYHNNDIYFVFITQPYISYSSLRNCHIIRTYPVWNMVTHLQLNHFQQEWLQWEFRPSNPAVWLPTGTQDLHLYPLCPKCFMIENNPNTSDHSGHSSSLITGSHCLLFLQSSF